MTIAPLIVKLDLIIHYITANSAISTMEEKIADLKRSVMYLTDQNICLIKSMERHNNFCMDLQEKVILMQGKIKTIKLLLLQFYSTLQNNWIVMKSKERKIGKLIL